jgi:hypothetical protein
VGKNPESRNAPTWLRRDTRRGSFKIPKFCTPRGQGLKIISEHEGIFVKVHLRDCIPNVHFDENMEKGFVEVAFRGCTPKVPFDEKECPSTKRSGGA